MHGGFAVGAWLCHPGEMKGSGPKLIAKLSEESSKRGRARRRFDDKEIHCVFITAGPILARNTKNRSRIGVCVS